MAKGTAIIDVDARLLPQALTLFPSTYRVVGSQKSEHDGTVRLVMESEDVALGSSVFMTCEVRDAGSTRTIVMHPVK
ncbi:hypothetical protein [Aquamicrobium soli]|uniref:Uncharacterized protein n=1 Tax=Aquamicrobium soli TaxID=1811518 RepID=A0ABV7KGF0_9HYPH